MYTEKLKFAVLLAGCGIGDGSQIEEVIATYVALDKIGVNYTPVALDAEQARVINHITEESETIERNILVESARVGRGRILSLSDISSDSFDALIIPGGIGLLANYTNLFNQENSVAVNEHVQSFVLGFLQSSKPIGLICSAIKFISIMFKGDCKSATLYGSTQQVGTNGVISYHNCSVTDIVVDEANNLVSTPAFLESQNLYEISLGIEKLVGEVSRRASSER